MSPYSLFTRSHSPTASHAWKQLPSFTHHCPIRIVASEVNACILNVAIDATWSVETPIDAAGGAHPLLMILLSPKSVLDDLAFAEIRS